MIVNCLHTVRKMSSNSVTGKLGANGLSIIEKYSFRGRGKYGNDKKEEEKNDSKKRKPEVKLPKVSAKSKKLKNESVDMNKMPDKNCSVKSVENVREIENSRSEVKSKKVKTKNSKSLVNSSEIDIEDCGNLLCNSPKKTECEEKKIKWVPENWEELLKNIREMRKDATAPVDDMGCHKAMDDNASPQEKRYQALISLMLSSQTKDQVTFATMLKLREHGLTVDNILKTDEKTLASLINSVGFWRIKAKHIKITTQILKDEYGGDIPDTVEKMLKLPGVGPKMAHLCMATAWNKVHGIGVDTHVHRISNRLEWVPNPTKTPEQTRIALEKWLPHALWYEVNHLMVGFGQQICLPINPKCEGCLNKNICPYGISELKNKHKKGKRKKE